MVMATEIGPGARPPGASTGTGTEGPERAWTLAWKAGSRSRADLRGRNCGCGGEVMTELRRETAVMRGSSAARRGVAQGGIRESDNRSDSRLESGPGTEACSGAGPSAGMRWGTRGGPLQVGVLGHPRVEAQNVADQLRHLAEVEVCDSAAGLPRVILCAAGAASRLVELLDPLVLASAAAIDRKDRSRVVEYRAPVALLDLLGEIGPEAAALHALHGYLTPGRGDQWLSCLRSADRRRAYAAAPEELAEKFLDAWADGPLTSLEREILGCVALGFTQPERAQRLHLGLSTLEMHERVLKERFDMDPRQHLAAVAVELGFYRHWSPDAG